jgi:hypothetical protein
MTMRHTPPGDSRPEPRRRILDRKTVFGCGAKASDRGQVNVRRRLTSFDFVASHDTVKRRVKADR